MMAIAADGLAPFHCLQESSVTEDVLLYSILLSSYCLVALGSLRTSTKSRSPPVGEGRHAVLQFCDNSTDSIAGKKLQLQSISTHSMTVKALPCDLITSMGISSTVTLNVTDYPKAARVIVSQVQLNPSEVSLCHSKHTYNAHYVKRACFPHHIRTAARDLVDMILQRHPSYPKVSLLSSGAYHTIFYLALQLFNSFWSYPTSFGNFGSLPAHLH